LPGGDTQYAKNILAAVSVHCWGVCPFFGSPRLSRGDFARARARTKIDVDK
jgi:hypothetical protein